MKLLSIDQQSSPHTNYQRTVKLKNLKRAFDLIRSGHCDSRVALARGWIERYGRITRGGTCESQYDP